MDERRVRAIDVAEGDFILVREVDYTEIDARGPEILDDLRSTIADRDDARR
jgi:hypothetical protein